jgi:hypothetical protein
MLRKLPTKCKMSWRFFFPSIPLDDSTSISHLSTPTQKREKGFGDFAPDIQQGIANSPINGYGLVVGSKEQP